MIKQTFSIQKALDFGWETTKKHFWFFVGILALIISVANIPGIIGEMFSEKDLPLLVFIFFAIGALLFWFLQILLSVGTTMILLSFVKGKKPKFSVLFDGISYVVHTVVSSFLYGLVTAVGFVLLILPGVYFWIRFQFYTYFIVEKKAGPIEALQMSWRATEGVFWQVLLFNLVIVGVNIAGALLLGIGLLWSIPTSMLAVTHVYKQLTVDTQTQA